MSATDLRPEADHIKASTRIAEVIGQTVPLKRQGRLWTACCPFHAEKTPSFYVYPDHFHCFGCGSHGDVIAWVMQTERLTFPEAIARLEGESVVKSVNLRTYPQRTSCRHEAPDGQEAARRIWVDAIDPRGTLVETYLRHRGVSLPEAPVIRFHPRCTRELDGPPLPAMVALMTDPDTGRETGVHRTYLQSDGTGKAPIEKPKKMRGPAGVIRLAEPISEGLGLAEGIETALSVMQAIGWRPVWAAGTRGGIERFPVLPGHCLTIFADGDAPGLAAARACTSRWNEAGRETWIHVPPTGEDWNDAARRLAP